MKPTSKTLFRLVLLALVGAAMAYGYRLMFLDHAPTAFASHEEDMSYAWYVPLFSLYVLFRERRRIAASVGAPSAWGFVLLVPALLSGFIGIRGYQLRFEILGFALTLLSLAWIFFGGKTARAVAFPLIFLLFCMPLATFLDMVTVYLRLFAVAVAEGALKGFGCEVIRVGTMLQAADGSFAIDIASPCSGLRSLFAMMALTAGYAYLTHRTWTVRALLFALSIPIAIIGNVVRILSIAFIAAYASNEFALGFYHDYSGYVVFAIAISLMLATSSVLARLFPEKERPAEPAAKPPRIAAFGSIPVALAFVLTLAVMAFQSVESNPQLADAPAWQLPELGGFESKRGEASPAELKTLPPDTRIERRFYRDRWGGIYVVSLVVGGKSKSSIHRPELCLPSQGFSMSDPHDLAVGEDTWRVLTLARGRERHQYAYTFANQDGYRTSSHVRRILRDVWDRSFCNRIDRWSMLTVDASSFGEPTLREFLRLIVKAIK